MDQLFEFTVELEHEANGYFGKMWPNCSSATMPKRWRARFGYDTENGMFCAYGRIAKRWNSLPLS